MTDGALEPTVFEQVSLYVVVDVGLTLTLPGALFTPDQPPLAVHVTGTVASVFTLHDNVTLSPLVIDVLDADSVAIGATCAGGGVTVPPDPFPDVEPPEPDEVPPLLPPPEGGDTVVELPPVSTGVPDTVVALPLPCVGVVVVAEPGESGLAPCKLLIV